MAQTVSNVTAAKPKVAGAVYRAAAGTTLPTDSSTALSSDFKCLGYISEDGLTNAMNREFLDEVAWGGDVVNDAMTRFSESFKFKMIEALNLDVLQAVYGSSNATGTLANGITVNVNSDDPAESVWVFEMLLKSDAVKRIVVPIGKVTTVGDVVYSSKSSVGYDVTLSCKPDSAGKTHYEYIKSA